MTSARLDSSPEDGETVETVHARAVARYEAGRNVEALADLERLASLAPAGSFYIEHYYYFRINILGFRYGDFAGVVAVCEEATNHCPAYAPIWFLKGRVLAEIGRDSASLRALIRAGRLAPDDGPTAYELAKLLQRLSRRRAARSVAEHARSLGVAEPLLDNIIAGAPPQRPAQAESFSRWRPPPITPRACEGVFLVVGSSYCGSTLLTAIMGAHPKIAGVGELHWLVREPLAARLKEGICVFCGDACKVWTPAIRADADVGNVYDLAAWGAAKPYVCDGSKMPDWSDHMAPFTPAPRLRILMVKHPLRHVASFVEKARRAKHPGPMVDIDNVLTGLSELYEHARREPPDVILRYEDLVTQPSAALRPILARFGLEWDDAMDKWRTAPQHFIGGNAGPRSQIMPTLRPHGGFLQRKYNRPDVFLDDSFATVLTPAEIDQVLAHPAAQAVCADFGYEPRIDPGAVATARGMDVRVAKERLRAAPVNLIGPFEPDGEDRYIARLELLAEHAYFSTVADTPDTSRRSPVWLLEDGRPLGPAHIKHKWIGERGQGRFSHWHEVLYFSASDNSDPNLNGRRYAVTLDSGWRRLMGWAKLCRSFLHQRSDERAGRRTKIGTIGSSPNLSYQVDAPHPAAPQQS